MIGVFTIGQQGLADYAAAVQPSVMLHLDPPSDNVKAALTIGRKYYDVNAQAWLLSDPQAGGEQLAQDEIAMAQITGIDTFMGLNEPPVDNPDAIARLCQLERTRTTMLNAAGLRSVVLSLSVGWPAENLATRQLITEGYRDFLNWLPAMNYVGLHEYWTCAGPLAPENYDPLHPSKVWRFQHWDFDKPVLVTECGVDHNGQPSDGWQSCGFSAQAYAAQLVDYAALVCQDKRVRGIVVFQWGGGGWPSFDVAPYWRDMMAAWNYAPPVVPVTQPIRVLVDGRVVTLPLEEYLRAVVPSEVPALWPAEAVKAQAVAARSYALAAIAAPRHANADVCSTTCCQVYNEAKIHPASDAAISATAGVTLLYNGAVIPAYFSANCGGTTSSNEAAFGGAPVAWCRPVDCVNKSVKNGHGVGLCQWGAHDMAASGADYKEILKHYYTGVSLSGEGDNMSDPYLPIDSRIPANLQAHNFVNNVVYGSVVRIVDALEAWKRWGHTDQPVNGQFYWKADYLTFIDEVAAAGKTLIYVSCVDENGLAVPAAKVWFGYPSERLQNTNWVGQFDNGGGNGDVFVYPAGSGEITQGQNSFNGVVNGSTTVGPYCLAMQQDGPSEVVAGFGLTNNHHICFAVRFRRAIWGGDTPTPPEPDGCLTGVLTAILKGLKGA